jgi:hypothetical protein
VAESTRKRAVGVVDDGRAHARQYRGDCGALRNYLAAAGIQGMRARALLGKPFDDAAPTAGFGMAKTGRTRRSRRTRRR